MTAAAGIRALLVSCHSEAPRPVLTGGAACSTFRSTMSRNGTSCCAKRGFAMASNRALAIAAAARLSSLHPPSNGEFPPAPDHRYTCSTMEQTKAYHRGLYRLPVTYPAMYCVMSTVGEGTITNLSAVGCTIETDQPLLADQDVALCLLLPDQHESLPIETCPVRWVHATSSRDRIHPSGTHCESPAVRFRIGPDGATRFHCAIQQKRKPRAEFMAAQERTSLQDA